MSKITTNKEKNMDKEEEVRNIIDKLESLNLINLKELCDKLQEKYGIKVSGNSSINPSASESSVSEIKLEKVSVKIKNIGTGVNQLKLYNDIRGMIKEINGEEESLLQIIGKIKDGKEILKDVPSSKIEEIKKLLEGVEIEVK